MNRIYKSLWNEKTKTFVAVAENASSKGKTTGSQVTVTRGVKKVVANTLLALGLSSVALAVQAATVAGQGAGTSITSDECATGTQPAFANAASAIAAGCGSFADNADSIAIGSNAQAIGKDAGNIAIGKNSLSASDGNSIAIGNDASNSKTGLEQVAIGSQASSNGQGAVSIGKLAITTADRATAIGDKAQSNALSSVAFGTKAEATAEAVAGLALGSEAKVSQSNGVALGANSIAEREVGRETGYQPVGGDPIEAVRAQGGEVSVGSVGQERRITNVAAGAIGTDAVNVSQLKAVDSKVNKGLSFKGNTGPTVNKKLGDTLSIQGGMTDLDPTAASDENTRVSTDNNGDVTFELSKNLTGLESIDSKSITTNSINVGGGAFTIDNNNFIVGKNKNIDMGNNSITNMAAGVNDDDAVSVKQLNDKVGSISNKGWELAAGGVAGTENIASGDTATFIGGENIEVERDGATLTYKTKDAVNFKTVNVDESVTVAGSTNITNEGLTTNKVTSEEIFITNAGDTINVGETLDSGITFVDGAGNKTEQKLGSQLGIIGDNNINTKITDNELQVTLKKDLTGLNSVTSNTISAGGGVFVADDTGITVAPNKTINMGDNRVRGVADGVVGSDAVNLSQLKTVEGTANKGWNLTGNGEADFNVKPGDSVSIEEGKNIAISRENGDITVATAADVDFDSVAVAGNTSISNLGLTTNAVNVGSGTFIANDAGISIGAGKTINMGGNRIEGVKAGKEGTDAVNLSQLEAVEGTANKGWNLTGNGEADFNVKPGDSVSIEGGKNIAVTREDGNLTVATAADVDFDEITVNNNMTVAGDTQLGDSFSVINNEVTYNVEPGDITNDYQVINKKYVDQSSQEVIDNNPITFAGTNGSIERKLGETLNVVGANGNITTTADGDDLSIALNDDLKLKSITTGNTVMDNNGLRIGNAVNISADGFFLQGGPSISSTGINAGDMRITNVKAGKDATDAVNVSQLQGVEDSIGDLDDRAVKYDGKKGDPKDTITLEGDKGTTITNVANGKIEADSKDAVNGGQVHEMGDSIAQGMGGDSKFEDGKLITDLEVAGNRYDNVNDALGGVHGDLSNKIENVENNMNAGWNITDADGNLTNIGPDGNVAFTGDDNISVAQTGSKDNGQIEVSLSQDLKVNSITAVQVNANKVTANEVAINNGPVINENGIDMREKKITNVAAGTDPGDAVNVSQLDKVRDDMHGDINSVRDDVHRVDQKLRAGVAAAMATAGLPQAYLPGKSMMALGGGTWKGESGMALGVSKITDNGKWVLKLSGNASSRGDYGGTVGAGYQW